MPIYFLLSIWVLLSVGPKPTPQAYFERGSLFYNAVTDSVCSAPCAHFTGEQRLGWTTDRFCLRAKPSSRRKSNRFGRRIYSEVAFVAISSQRFWASSAKGNYANAGA